MKEPRPPLFGFLWPGRRYDGPVDHAFVQSRLVRIAPRGFPRIALLSALSLAAVLLTSVAALAALANPLSAGTLVGAAVAATLVVITLRAWVVGTYVTDSGVVVETMLRRRTASWEDVTQILCESGAVPALGSPLPVPGRRMVISLRSGETLPTHVYTASPDLVLRRDAFDVARDRLENWSRRA